MHKRSYLHLHVLDTKNLKEDRRAEMHIPIAFGLKLVRRNRDLALYGQSGAADDIPRGTHALGDL